ncbi:hypothetical protein D3C84_449420 [compost metagenome]
MPGSGGDAQVVQDDRARPAAVEIELLLLLQQFFRREGLRRRRQQFEFELGNRQEQRARCRRWARFRQWLAGREHQWAYPFVVEFLLRLLGNDLFRRERRGRFVGQFHVEFGNGQEQRLRRANLSVYDVAGALRDDLGQQVRTACGFVRAVDDEGRVCVSSG